MLTEEEALNDVRSNVALIILQNETGGPGAETDLGNIDGLEVGVDDAEIDLGVVINFDHPVGLGQTVTLFLKVQTEGAVEGAGLRARMERETDVEGLRLSIDHLLHPHLPGNYILYSGLFRSIKGFPTCMYCVCSLLINVD